LNNLQSNAKRKLEIERKKKLEIERNEQLEIDIEQEITLATKNADINIKISHNDENEIIQPWNNNEIEITKQRKNEIEIKKQRMIENAIYKIKNSNRQDQSAASNTMPGQGTKKDKHAIDAKENKILQAWQRTFLPARTICAVSTLVLGMNGPGTDDFLQLLFDDTPSHN
jgi:hypothetical protein